MKLWRGDILPDDLVTQKIAFVGRTGSGKTYAANVLAEQLLGAGHQVVVLDWVGNWYGLRLNKRGNGSSKLPIYVFGGDYGDVPLEPTSGELIADVVVGHGISVVLDVSEFSKAKRSRFATDFAERLLWRKRKDKMPMHVVVEEAQAFVPQRVSKGGERMLGAFEELIKVGRNRGIGTSLLTQRPQAVNKEALNQTELLLTFQLNAKHERKAIQDWVAEHNAGEDYLADLPRLKPGQAVVWSPMWLGFLGCVHILRRQSFDASKTPELGDRSVSEVAPLDLGALEEAMAQTIETKKLNDPSELKRLLAESGRACANLEIERDRLKLELENAAQNPDMRDMAHQVIQDCDRGMAEIDNIEATLTNLRATFERIRLRCAENYDRADRTEQLRAARRRSAIVEREDEGDRKAASMLLGPPNGELTDLGTGAPRKVFETLAFWHPRRLSRSKLAFHSEISPKSSTLRGAMAMLRKLGWLDSAGGTYALNDEGVRVAGNLVDQRPREPEEVIKFWQQKFGGNATGRVFDMLVKAWSSGVERDHLAEAAGISPGSSTFRGALADLRACELLDDSSQLWTLSKELLS
jgi:hypothetical protein